MGMNNSLGDYVTYAGEGLAAIATAGAVALTTAAIAESDSVLTYQGMMSTLFYSGVVGFFSMYRASRNARMELEEALGKLEVVAERI